MKKLEGIVYLLFCTATAMIGYNIHGSIFYAVINFLLAPLSWLFWLLGQDVNLTVIKQTFEFFLR